MRMEKFIEAAQVIVDKAVPVKPRDLPLQFAVGKDFLTADGGKNGDPMTFYEKREVARRFHAAAAGDYQFVLYAMVDGIAKPDPQRCVVTATSDGKEFFKEEYHWADCEFFTHEKQIHWDKGDHDITFAIRPVKAELKQTTKMDYKILTVSVYGPLDPKDWTNPPGYDRFFTRDQPPEDPAERRAYAREVLARFATKAFRRPASKETVEQLANIAEKTYSTPGNTFETGVSRAMAGGARLAAVPLPRGSQRSRLRRGSPSPTSTSTRWLRVFPISSGPACPTTSCSSLPGEGKLRQNLAAASQADVGRSAGQGADSRTSPGNGCRRRRSCRPRSIAEQILAREGITTRGQVTTAQRRR